MKRSGSTLKVKIMAGVGSLVLAFGFTAMGNIHHGLSRTLKEELTRRGTTIALVLRGPAEEFLLTDNQFALYQLFEQTMRTYDDVRYIYVRGPTGDVQTNTFTKGIPRGLAEANPDRGASPEDFRVQLIDTDEGRIQDIATPLLGGRLGGVHVGMTERSVRRRLANAVLGWGMSTTLLLIVGLWVAYLLTSRLAERLSRLIEVARQVGEGNLDVRAHDDVGDEVGRLAGALNSMIEDLKRSRSGLIRTGKLAAIGELASCVAHEINNPLNTMAVCTQALLDRSEDPDLRASPSFEEFPEYLKSINEEIFRCKKITSGLLDFARHKEPRQTEWDLNSLVCDTLPLVSHHAKQAGLELSFIPDKGRIAAKADGDQIRQVLINILINAVDHTPAGGSVRIWTERRPDAGVVRIEDSGCGIPAENLQKVFEPFFTTRPQGKGTGLGLAICHKIIENHHGSLEVRSEVGKGSTFSFSLPLNGKEAGHG